MGKRFLAHAFFLANVSPRSSLAARFLVEPLSCFSLVAEGFLALDAVGVGLEAIRELRRVPSGGATSPDDFLGGIDP